MMLNIELGVATEAYVKQTFGEDQIGVDYYVTVDSSHQDFNHLVIVWDRAEPVPTDEQLETALNTWNWDYVRKERNALLAATDFYALSDVTMSDAMTTYRQALRDLPASVENSEDVVWPEKP
jgi:hypothetical protein